MNFDEIDKKLLGLLQKNSKQTNKQLSLELNLSVTAVYERIKRLEREGVINKYVALLNAKKVSKSFLVFCHVKLGKHNKEFVTTFEKEVVQLNEVLECHHVSGDYDYILKIRVKGMDEYRDFMLTKLTTIKHIGSTQSTFVISDIKKTTAITV
ncbi:Lrp/AsnC family transcriptional regulator [Pseudofulvibacter geojedonensis]|uniref:Lrp/AsnC family transcriptional regulator n=1 Tax=Pseudofulvibacter geojedonensis TaxID=1123758 RepID=A0ABW3I2V7_9FLAO